MEGHLELRSSTFRLHVGSAGASLGGLEHQKSFAVFDLLISAALLPSIPPRFWCLDPESVARTQSLSFRQDFRLTSNQYLMLRTRNVHAVLCGGHLLLITQNLFDAF